MPRVVGVHGIAQHFKGAHTTAAAWLPAIRDGLVRAGARLARDDEFSCAFYGDLFRKKGTRSATVPPYTARDVDNEWEQDLLETWWRAAAEVDPMVASPDAKTRARTPALVQRALNNLSKSKFFRALGGERVLIFGLKQVRLYLHDEQVKAAAQERLAEHVDDDTRVIVGHSLGSVVAYEALCAHPEWPVTTLVTLGSPLGIREVVFDQLTPSPEGGLGQGPHVEQWHNVADSGDLVALVKQLDGQFDSKVQDRLVHNGWESHDVTRYLTAKETGEAIATGL